MRMVEGSEVMQPRCTLLPHASNNSRQLAGPMPVTTFPQRRPTREPATTNAKFFESGVGKTLGPLSSGGGKRAISQIGEQGPL